MRKHLLQVTLYGLLGLTVFVCGCSRALRPTERSL